MKKAILVLAVISLFAGTAFASLAKINALGVPSWMVQDELLAATIFPQLTLSHSNTMVAELATGSAAFGRAYVGMGSNVLGIVANMPSASSIAPLLRNYGIIYGLGMKGMDVGIGLMYGTSGSKTSNNAILGDVAGDYTSLHSMDAGIIAGANLGKMDIGLTLNYADAFTADSQTKDATGALTAEGKSGISGIELQADGRMDMGSDMMGNIKIGFVTSSNLVLTKAWTGINLTTHTEDNTAAMVIGGTIGLVKSVKVGSVTLLLGVDPTIGLISSARTQVNKLTSGKIAGDTESSIMTLGIPIYAAAEGKVNDTWVFRGGINKPLWNLTSTTTVIKNVTGDKLTNNVVDASTSPAPVFTIGLTGTIGDISIDAQVNSNILLNAPYFISGNTTANFDAIVAFNYKWK
jgi:hypothetical protein